MCTSNCKLFFTLFLVLLIGQSQAVLGSDDEYIIPELLDIDTIRAEEQLSEDAEVARIYIFLAIWNGSRYDTYTTDGRSDLDSDGDVAAEEPNDLEEYHADTNPIPMEKAMQIDGDDHTTYISALPNFEKIFPNDENPLANDSLIDVQTSATLEDNTRLTGYKSLPVVTQMGEREGIDRFIAFYNKRGEGEGDKNDILSFGFIEVQLLQE